MKHIIYLLSVMILSIFSYSVLAIDVINQKNIALDLANDLAKISVEKCRKKGYQVSSVIVDRHANLRTAMRDDLAARQTLEIAKRKANMVIMAGIDSGTFRDARSDIRLDLNHIDGLIVMQGGVAIRAGGALIGAIGISGAPGGDIDEACAKEALASIQERLDFADDE